MEKINFENGQLLEGAYVTINGVKHDVVKAKYTGKTPISAFVLNALQENIEQAIEEKSSLPEGGTTGQVLAKVSNLNYDARWVEPVDSESITRNILPIGSTIQWFADAIPENWLLCNGQAVSRTEYATLFTTLGTKYGTGNGSTTFNLPNLKGRIAVGLDTNDTDFNTLGKTGGEKKHKLTVNELAQHQVSFKDGGKLLVASGNAYGVPDYVIKNGQTLYSDSVGGDQPHNNLQPYMVCTYIIKAK